MNKKNYKFMFCMFKVLGTDNLSLGLLEQTNDVISGCCNISDLMIKITSSVWLIHFMGCDILLHHAMPFYFPPSADIHTSPENVVWSIS